MNIGMVTEELPYLPSAGGFRLYGANLIRGLSRRHRVDLISLVRDGDERHLDWARTYCASVRVIPVKTLGRWSAAASLLSAHLWGKPLRQRAEMAHMLKTYADDWDVMHVEGEYVGGLLPPLAFPKILSVHDSWTLKCEEMLKCSQSLKETLYYRMMCWHEPRYERLVYPRFQRVVVVAERDQEAVRKTVPNSRVTVIGNGTDTHYFHPVPVEKDSTMVRSIARRSSRRRTGARETARGGAPTVAGSPAGRRRASTIASRHSLMAMRTSSACTMSWPTSSRA